MRKVLRKVMSKMFDLIDGGGKTTERDPWATLEVIPGPEVVPPGMRLTRCEDTHQWIVSSVSGDEIVVDFEAMGAVARAWSVCLSLTSDRDCVSGLPHQVSVTHLSDTSYMVEFLRHGIVAASPEFITQESAENYVRRLVSDVDAGLRGAPEGGNIWLPEGFQLVTHQDDAPFSYYTLSVAGHHFNLLIEKTGDGESDDMEALCMKATDILHAVRARDVRIVKTSYGPYVIEYMPYGDEAVTLIEDFDSFSTAQTVVSQIEKRLLN